MVAITLLLVAPGLGLRDPWPADEPRFVLIAKDMLRTGDWLLPRVGGDLYQDKPPLYFWLLALTIAVTGSLRTFLVPSLLATVGSVLLVYDLGRRFWGREAGLAAGLILVATAQFVWQGRQAQIDATLCFFTTLGLYGLLRHLLVGPSWPWYWIGWVAAGLGVITKGVGFLPLLVLIPYGLARLKNACWRGDRRARIPGAAWRWAMGPICLVLAICVWLVPVLVAAVSDPLIAAYRDEILFGQTVDRYANAWHHEQPPWFFLVNVIPGLWMPITALLPWLLPRWHQAIRDHDIRILLLLSWIALVVLFFSLSSGKRGVYVLPAIPALALAAAPWIRDLSRSRGPQRVLFSLACLLPTVLAGAALYLWLIAPEQNATLRAEEGIDAPLPLLAMAAAGLGIALTLGKRRALAAYAAVLGVILGAMGLWVNPVMDAWRSGRLFARNIEALTADVPELGLVAYKEQYLLQLRRPTVNFGHSRWREWEQEADDAAAWLQADTERRVLLVDDAVRIRCFAGAETMPVDRENRKDWFLVRGAADLECVRRGRLTAALQYHPV